MGVRQDGEDHRRQAGGRGTDRAGRRVRVYPEWRAHHADLPVPRRIAGQTVRHPARAGRRVHGRGLGADDPEACGRHGHGRAGVHQRPLGDRQRPAVQRPGGADRGLRGAGKRREARPPGHEPASRDRADGQEGVGLPRGRTDPRVRRPRLSDRRLRPARSGLPGAPLRRPERRGRPGRGETAPEPCGVPTPGSRRGRGGSGDAPAGPGAGRYRRQRRMVRRWGGSARRVRRARRRSRLHRRLRPRLRQGPPPRRTTPRRPRALVAAPLAWTRTARPWSRHRTPAQSTRPR